MLLDFLKGPARKARALYVLGDLFEVWIGDDAPLPPALEVASALRELADAGVEIGFVVGNRDFLVGEDYCSHAGMQLFEEPVQIFHQGHRLVLLHGDVLCTDDKDYQQFRAKVRDPAWQTKMLAKPAWLRRQLARFARFISKQKNRGKPESIMDVNAASVQQTMDKLAAGNLIHGHTHRPAIHRIISNNNNSLRAVLGDWNEDQGSAICIHDGQLELLDLVRKSSGKLEVVTRDSETLCSD